MAPPTHSEDFPCPTKCSNAPSEKQMEDMWNSRHGQITESEKFEELVENIVIISYIKTKKPSTSYSFGKIGILTGMDDINLGYL